VKDAVRVNKVAYEAWLENKAKSLHSLCAGTRKSAALAVKKSKMQSWKNFRQLDSEANKVAGQQSALANHPVSSQMKISYC